MAADGAVRLIWGEVHRRATQVTRWVHSGAPPEWTGEGQDRARWTDLFVGAVVDGAVQRGEPITVEASIRAAAVVLGADGVLHVGFYADVDGEAGYDVRVLGIGSAD